MPIRRASLLMPCSRLEDFPTRLRGPEAADLLAAWTTLWHPALIHATGKMPGWHSADEPPEPEALDGELVIVPAISRERLAVDWHDRVTAANPSSPPPLDALPSRQETVAAALSAAALTPDAVPREIAADFLALGYAHLQVELVTRAMRYTSVLDVDEFRDAVIDAAKSAVAGDSDRARDGLGRSFDMLADARNHFYGVDFYLIDVTLLTGSTLGDALQKKLASGPATNVLGPSSLIEQMAREHPATLAELRSALAAERACVLAGPRKGSSLSSRDPEGILAELMATCQVHRDLLAREPVVFGQFAAPYSPLLPEVLQGLGIHASLFTAFDGNRCERPAQIKSRWGEQGGAAVDILGAVPVDIAEPGTWLSLGDRIAETLMRDHVATLMFAGWPGQASDYYYDLQRIVSFGSALGKFVTLDEYFRLTAESEDWTSFYPQAYALSTIQPTENSNPISSRIANYRRQVLKTFEGLLAGLSGAVGAQSDSNGESKPSAHRVSLNPWSFDSPRYDGFDPLESGMGGKDVGQNEAQSAIQYHSSTPACGFTKFELAPAASTVSLAEGRTLRNEFVELVVSESTGGIQSLRKHGDRSTRVSQRLVMHDRHLRRDYGEFAGQDGPQLDVQMLAERIDITRNDAITGEITSHGQILDADRQPLAEFSQSVRLVRGLPAAIVNVRLSIELAPEGDMWSSYFASRLAWREEAVSFRHGVDWTARPTGRSRIESAEWVEISDAVGSITCFGLGLPFHKLAGPTWLDTVLSVAGESESQFQFAIGLDCRQPTQTALSLLTSGRPSITNLPSPPTSPTGWFFHISAKHVLITHLEPLPPPQAGVRLRLLEVEGQAVRTSLTAFRPFQSAQRTDFRGESIEELKITDGRVQFEIGAFGWMQIEAKC